MYELRVFDEDGTELVFCNGLTLDDAFDLAESYLDDGLDDVLISRQVP